MITQTARKNRNSLTSLASLEEKQSRGLVTQIIYACNRKIVPTHNLTSLREHQITLAVPGKSLLVLHTSRYEEMSMEFRPF